MKKFFSFFIGTVMGALVGATLALLLTPSSGETLRGQIQERFASLQEELAQAASDRRAELEEYLTSLREANAGIEIEK